MRFGAHGKGRRGQSVGAAVVLVVVLLSASAPGLAADFAPHIVEAALESAVRIDVILHWADQVEDAEFSGSGWTRQCLSRGGGYEVLISTAAHVLDLPALEEEARPGRHTPAVVKVLVSYRDGRQYHAGNDDLRVDRVHDYGEVRLHSSVPRGVLPDGNGDVVPAGTHLFTVASPGLLAYAYFEGTVISPEALLVGNAPKGALLVSIPVAPGASGAPVMDDGGCVVAMVVGYVEWPWGGTASLVVALPRSLLMLSASQLRALEVKQMGFLDNVLPAAKAVGLFGLAGGLVWQLLALMRGRVRLTPEVLHIIMVICEKAVMAIEQAHGDLAGIDKKQFAQEMIGEILSQLRVYPPKPLVDAGIESAVLGLTHPGQRKAS